MCTTAIRLGGLVLAAAVAVTGSQPSTAAGAGRPPPRLRSRPGPRRRPRRPAHTGGEPPRLLPDPARTPGAVASTDLATGLRPGLQPPGPAAGHQPPTPTRQRRDGWPRAIPATTGLGAADVAEHHLVRLALGGYPRSEQKPVAAAPGTSGAATAATSARRPRDCPEHLLRAIIAA